jgi:hypothetical protein
MDIMQPFTTGLNPVTQTLLNAYAGGAMKIKTVNEVQELVDNMSLNEYHAHTEEEAAPKKKGMIDLNAQDSLHASTKHLIIQLETLAKRLEAHEVAQLSTNATCDFCEQANESGVRLLISLGLSEEQVKYMGTFTRQHWNPYSNTYNPGWTEHPNFSYRSNNVPHPPQTNCTPPRNPTTNEKSH